MLIVLVSFWATANILRLLAVMLESPATSASTPDKTASPAISKLRSPPTVNAISRTVSRLRSSSLVSNSFRYLYLSFSDLEPI